ncbi:MAG: SDR family NAD(P)-dependent oxidoreductase, partial [Thermoplasmata archaeon]|nr:SDR family NAD(P)-dependent oxidoreductase [Thermoplasmata archaeon]
KAEFASSGILSFNINPGYVRTERNQLTTGDDGMDSSAGAPPEAIGAVIAWLATSPEAVEMNGVNVEAQDFCRERGLYEF